MNGATMFARSLVNFDKIDSTTGPKDQISLSAPDDPQDVAVNGWR